MIVIVATCLTVYTDTKKYDNTDELPQIVSCGMSYNENAFTTLKQITQTSASTEVITLSEKTTEKTTKIKPTEKTKVSKVTTICTEVRGTYNDNDLYVLSHVIYGESSGCSDDMQLSVGSVVLNRVSSDEFPDSIYGVVFQEGQYACTWDGNYDKTPDRQAIANAQYLLEHGSILPEYVLYQAEFIQGDIYKQIGNVYFCY